MRRAGADPENRTAPEPSLFIEMRLNLRRIFKLENC